MRLLELFCGTKSVSKAIGSNFSEIISVDINEKAQPTFVADILTWNYKQFPEGYFHTIWASPPCVEYSIINQTHPGKVCNYTLADSIVLKTMEIIEYFNPVKWFIENPQSGTLKDREFMEGLLFVDCDYCRFSNWGYRKRTRFWSNVISDNVLCLGAGKCPNMYENHHRVRIGFPKVQNEKMDYTNLTLNDRYRIPPELIKYLFNLKHY